MAFGQKQGYPYSIPGALPQATVRQGPWPCDLPSIVPLLAHANRFILTIRQLRVKIGSFDAMLGNATRQASRSGG